MYRKLAILLTAALTAVLAVAGTAMTPAAASARPSPATGQRVVFLAAANYAAQASKIAPHGGAQPAYTIYCTLKPNKPTRSGSGVYGTGTAQCTPPGRLHHGLPGADRHRRSDGRGAG